jgi:crotonobetaine/carnitine-CoA ligase
VGAKNAALLADVRPTDIMFLWEPFYHIAAWMTFIAALQHGVSVALVERFSASQCWNQIRETGSTLFHYLGGAMNILLKQPPDVDDTANSVRIAWGAAAPARSWREFENRFGVVIREGYGISEAQNFTHLNLDGRVGSIGKPVAEFTSWIADDDGKPAAPRVVGEIVVKPKAANITMVGYFRDPKRTSEVLRDGCVHTGDLGFMDEDGYFYYAGARRTRCGAAAKTSPPGKSNGSSTPIRPSRNRPSSASPRRWASRKSASSFSWRRNSGSNRSS